MPYLDVSDVFDPSFFDVFNLVRRPEVTGPDGFATTSDTVIPDCFGVVTAASPNDLQRLAEADVSLKSITLITTTRVQLGSAGFKADVVQWAGDNYQVVLVEDYSRYGEGYLFCIAQATDYQIAPPTAELE